jgi:S-adenosylmethionine-dependent methyltransferase
MGDARWNAGATDDFVAHYETLYGRVRTHVLHAHLTEHLPVTPATIVDVGGGAGHQSIPLARLGYDVTIVDPSTEMLAVAAERIETELPDVAARVRLVTADGEDAPRALDGERFDGVLCHGVLMYLAEPGPMLAALAALARPNGIVSIVTKNRRTMALAPATRGEWRDALAAFDAEREVNGLGIDTRADDPDELAARLSAHGVKPIATYGVRVFTEGWIRNRPATDPVDDVLAVEVEASRRDPYRQLSRLFHLVGRKADDQRAGGS